MDNDDDDADNDNDPRHGGKKKRRRTAADINLWPYFNSSCYDDEADFFRVYEKAFDLLVAEEIKWADRKSEEGPVKANMFPRFGNQSTPYAKVDNFYSFWGSFSSHKTFAWMDSYRLSEAPNRQIRRLMEKDNNKARKERKKEFDSQVCSLFFFDV